MSFEGSGTGLVTYVIANEPAVNCPSCTVVVLEDDSAGMLTLNLSFTDSTYDQVQVGISVFNYSPTTTTYSDVTLLMMGFYCETLKGGWVSNTESSTESSVSFYVRQTAGTTSTSYSGSFNATNLTWVGPGQQDSLDIKFGSYSFNVTNTSTPNTNDRQGTGTGSVTYAIGDAASSTTAVTASTYNHYDSGVLAGISASLKWTDPVQGEMVLVLAVFPFSGSGEYNSNAANQAVIVLVSTSNAGAAGNWSSSYSDAPAVSLDVTYSEQSYSAQWQGSLEGMDLAWQGTGSQPNLTLSLSSLNFTLTLS